MTGINSVKLCAAPPAIGSGALEMSLDAGDIDGDGSTVGEPGNGTAITQWVSNHDGVTSVSESNVPTQPTLNTGAVNGLPAINFSGSDRLFIRDTFGILGNPDITLFMVAIDDTAIAENNNGSFGGMAGLGGGDGAGTNVGFTNDPGYRFNNGFQDYSPAGGPTGVVTGSFHVLEWRINGGQTYADHEFFSDGVNPNASPSIGSGTNVLNLTAPTASAGGFSVGKRFNAAGGFVDSNDTRIAEVLLYSRLSDAC